MSLKVIAIGNVQHNGVYNDLFFHQITKSTKLWSCSSHVAEIYSRRAGISRSRFET